VLKVLQDGAVGTASRARLRGLPDAQQDEVRKYLEDSLRRFFAAMRIEKGAAGGKPQAASGAAAAAPRGAPAKAPAAKAAEAKKKG
jgi:hypothetical protein